MHAYDTLEFSKCRRVQRFNRWRSFKQFPRGGGVLGWANSSTDWYRRSSSPWRCPWSAALRTPTGLEDAAVFRCGTTILASVHAEHAYALAARVSRTLPAAAGAGICLNEAKFLTNVHKYVVAKAFSANHYRKPRTGPRRYL